MRFANNSDVLKVPNQGTSDAKTPTKRKLKA